MRQLQRVDYAHVPRLFRLTERWRTLQSLHRPLRIFRRCGLTSLLVSSHRQLSLRSFPFFLKFSSFRSSAALVKYYTLCSYYHDTRPAGPPPEGQPTPHPAIHSIDMLELTFCIFQADKALGSASGGFSFFGGRSERYENAADLYTQAANAFRIQKMSTV